MKNLIIIKLWKMTRFLLLPLATFLLLFSCSKEIEESTFEESESTSLRSATCDNPIVGATLVQKGSVESFSVIPRIPTRSPRSIVWSTTGSLTIIGGQGTRRVTLRVGSGFRTGEVKVSINGGVCQTVKRLGVKSAKCPTAIQIDYAAGRNFCDDFGITLSGSNDVKSVRWYYSIKHINNKYFGTTTNPYDSYAMFKALYLPASSYSNHILWVTAKVTLNDGTTCTLKGRTNVTCSGNGGNGSR